MTNQEKSNVLKLVRDQSPNVGVCRTPNCPVCGQEEMPKRENYARANLALVCVGLAIVALGVLWYLVTHHNQPSVTREDQGTTFYVVPVER